MYINIMLKKLLYLYNDGHIPFPQGKGGLGYHLPQYRKRMSGDGLKFDKDGNLLFVPDANMTSEQAVYANTQLWEAEHQLPPLKNIPDEEDETGIKLIEDEEIDAKNKAEVQKHELLSLLKSMGEDTSKYYRKIDNEKVKRNEEKFLEDVLGKADEYQEEQIQGLQQDIKNISRKKSIGYGIAFEDYLVNPENVHVLKDELKFTSSLSSDHPILDTRIILGGQPSQLKYVIVYDLFSQDCVYEIKNFGISTRGFIAESYNEIKNSNSPFIEIQCTKIKGNPDFNPIYVLLNNGSFKLYNIEIKRNNQFLLPENEKGRDLKFIVMLKDGIYEYKPFDDDFKFEPSQIERNGKLRNQYIVNDKGEKIGQIFKPEQNQPFKKIIKDGTEFYKLNIDKFKRIKLFKQ